MAVNIINEYLYNDDNEFSENVKVSDFNLQKESVYLEIMT